MLELGLELTIIWYVSKAQEGITYDVIDRCLLEATKKLNIYCDVIKKSVYIIAIIVNPYYTLLSILIL